MLPTQLKFDTDSKKKGKENKGSILSSGNNEENKGSILSF